MGPPRTISAAAERRSPKKALQLAMINRSTKCLPYQLRQVNRAGDGGVAEFFVDLVEGGPERVAARLGTFVVWDQLLAQLELLGRLGRLESREAHAGEPDAARLDVGDLGQQLPGGLPDDATVCGRPQERRPPG